MNRRFGFGLAARVLLATSAGLPAFHPTQSAARLIVKEKPEARRRREIAQWNADVDAKKRAK